MRYGEFGGRYVPEVLIPPLKELEESYINIRDEEFYDELDNYLKSYAGRPTPLYYAKNLTEKIGGAKIYLKREDLLHGGAHKINNTIGQALIANKMGKERLIAETGAGQHGVATAMAGALFNMDTEIFMGKKDVERQKENVFRMELLGAEVIPVESGSKTLKDAINETLRDWVGTFDITHYLIGSVVGPHPYPSIVRDMQTVIGKETEKQLVPLNWDRRHQINATITLGKPGNYAVSFIGRYGTGLPYTPTFQNVQTAFENSARKPDDFNVDMYMYKDIEWWGLKYSFFVRVFNLFDRLNEKNVFTDTGRAGYTLAPLYVGGLRPRGLNTLDQYFIRPDFYSSPRRVQIGLELEF